jgi:TolB protein
VVDSAGINPRLVYAGPNTIVATAWSPDGLTIAFAMSVGQPNEFEIFLLDTEGTNARQISSGLLGVGGSLDWSPDGKTLLIYAGPPGDKDIFTLDIAAGNWRQLTDGGNNAASAYSPDGQFIVFNSLRNDDQADLFIMRADGSELRQLTDNPEPDWQPHWEP